MTGPPEPARDEFRRAMSRLAAGVSVLTTRDRGIDYAMTANSVTSVSLDPPLILACIHVEARFLEAVLESGIWGISVLPASERATAAWLATYSRPLHGQLDRIPVTAAATIEVALLDAAIVTVECRTTEVYPGGDHAIVLARVTAVGAPARAGDALLYYRGEYRSLD